MKRTTSYINSRSKTAFLLFFVFICLHTRSQLDALLPTNTIETSSVLKYYNIENSSQETPDDTESNEASETSIADEEYLQESLHFEYHFNTKPRHCKWTNAGIYIAFKGELFIPPPNI